MPAQNGPDGQKKEPNQNTLHAADFPVYDRETLDEMAEEATEQSQKELDELRKKFATVFSTQKGRDVLEHLFDKTLRRATWDPQVDNPEQHGYYREGENSLVAYITKMVNEGRTGEPHQSRKE